MPHISGALKEIDGQNARILVRVKQANDSQLHLLNDKLHRDIAPSCLVFVPRVSTVPSLYQLDLASRMPWISRNTLHQIAPKNNRAMRNWILCENQKDIIALQILRYYSCMPELLSIQNQSKRICTFIQNKYSIRK